MVRYEIGRTVGSIANVLEKFLEVYDEIENKVPQARLRSYSQENLATGKDEGMTFDDGPEERNAMSQYVDNNSQFDERELLE